MYCIHVSLCAFDKAKKKDFNMWTDNAGKERVRVFSRSIQNNDLESRCTRIDEIIIDILINDIL